MISMPKNTTTRLYLIIFIVSAIIVSSILWHQTHKSDSVDIDPTTVSEMENYLKQKECTQIMIDRSNGYDTELPKDCPVE